MAKGKKSSRSSRQGGEAMVWENELNERKKSILKSIIDDYVQTAQPVGSRTIARKHELGLGSATIRNEMADLEELGYITQPHTSAGRIPSDKGYRFYVDHLMQIHNLANEEIMKIKRAMEERIEELNQLVKKACSIISSVTGYTSVVLTPQFSKAEIKSVQFVVVDEKRLLVVVVAGMGIVNNKLIKHDTILDENSIALFTNVLNSRMSGRTIDEVTMPMIMEIQTLMGLPATFIFLVIEAVQECVRRIESTDVYLDGITNLLNYPEFSDLLKAREVLELLNEEDIIAALVKSSLKKNQKLDVKIGSENEIGPMKDLSVVTTLYGIDGKDIGAIGVIGPTRMAYGKVVSSIQFMQDLLNREITRIFSDKG